MNPFILFAGFVSFSASLAAHIAVWRARRPKNDLLALFVIFMAAPLALFAALWLAGALPAVAAPEALAWALLHCAISSAYIQSYPPAQAVSPSLEMMIIIGRSPDGLSGAEIARHFDNSRLVTVRFHDLINTSLIVRRGDAYVLSGAGRTLITGFVIYRKLLGLEFKGG